MPARSPQSQRDEARRRRPAIGAGRVDEVGEVVHHAGVAGAVSHLEGQQSTRLQRADRPSRIRRRTAYTQMCCRQITENATSYAPCEPSGSSSVGEEEPRRRGQRCAPVRRSPAPPSRCPRRPPGIAARAGGSCGLDRTRTRARARRPTRTPKQPVLVVELFVLRVRADRPVRPCRSA